MKFLLCLFCFLCLSAPYSVLAEDSQAKGTLKRDAPLPPATDAQFEEALKASDECKAYEFTNTRYDCDCVGMTFLEIRRKRGDDADAFWIREDAQKKCPNLPGVAGMIYSQCTGWAPFQRGEDYQEFCACYGNQFAKNYAKNPSENQYVVESQMIRALTSCNANSVNERLQTQDAFIKNLKDKGLYEKFFPGANWTGTGLPDQ